MWLDDIRVTDWQKLADFGVEKCYRFHGQSIDASQAVTLGVGVVGRIVQTEFRKNGTPWLVLWWEWPIDDGVEILHERIVLLAPATVTPTAVPPAEAGMPSLLFDFGSAVPPEHQAAARDLVGLARSIVTAQYAPPTASR